MTHRCYAKQYSDQMVCDVCGIWWDASDVIPPDCDTACLMDVLTPGSRGNCMSGPVETLGVHDVIIGDSGDREFVYNVRLVGSENTGLVNGRFITPTEGQEQ